MDPVTKAGTKRHYPKKKSKNTLENIVDHGYVRKDEAMKQVEEENDGNPKIRTGKVKDGNRAEIIIRGDHGIRGGTPEIKIRIATVRVERGSKDGLRVEKARRENVKCSVKECKM